MSSATPCAGCKFQRQKCTPDCTFAPYFPPQDLQKFANCHKVFGASNLAKIIKYVDPAHRANAVKSLVYEAEARLQNPIHGTPGYISLLQKRLNQVQMELFAAKNELSLYIGPSAMLPNLNQENPAQLTAMYNMQPTLGAPDPQYQQQHSYNQQMLEAEKLSAVLIAREQEEMMMIQQQLHLNHPALQQQHQTEINGLIDEFGQVTASGFTNLTGEDLGSYNNITYTALQQQQQQQQELQSKIEGLIDGFDIARDDGQVTASVFMDNITEQNMLSSLAFGPYKNIMYHTHHHQQQYQQSEIKRLIDGIDNRRNAEQVTTSGHIELTKEDMLPHLDSGSYNNIMYNTFQQQQQQQQQHDIKDLIEGFQNTRDAGHVSASGFELTEHDSLQSLVMGSYNNSMYNTNQQQQHQQQQQSEIEELIDGFQNTRNAAEVSASGFELNEHDTLQSHDLGYYNISMYNTHTQQQQQYQLQVVQPLLQKPEQPQLPNRDGVKEGGFRRRPPI